MICKRILSLLLALISLTLAVSCSQPTGGTVTPASTPTPTYPETTPIESETMITEFTNIPSPTPTREHHLDSLANFFLSTSHGVSTSPLCKEQAP